MSLTRCAVWRYVWRVPPPSSLPSSPASRRGGNDKQCNGEEDVPASRTLFKWGTISRHADVSLYEGPHMRATVAGKARTRNGASLQRGLPGGFAHVPVVPRQLPK